MPYPERHVFVFGKLCAQSLNLNIALSDLTNTFRCPLDKLRPQPLDLDCCLLHEHAIRCRDWSVVRLRASTAMQPFHNVSHGHFAVRVSHHVATNSGPPIVSGHVQNGHRSPYHSVSQARSRSTMSLMPSPTIVHACFASAPSRVRAARWQCAGDAPGACSALE